MNVVSRGPEVQIKKPYYFWYLSDSVRRVFSVEDKFAIDSEL